MLQVQYNRTIANIEAMKSDGRLSCRFTRDRSIDIGPTFWQWNDEDEEYHILMAKGDADKRGTYAYDGCLGRVWLYVRLLAYVRLH